MAQAMHKSLNQLVREYLELPAGQDQAERDAEEFRRLSSAPWNRKAKNSAAQGGTILPVISRNHWARR